MNIQIQLKMNIILRKDKTKSDLAQFHHGACFSPVESIFNQAIINDNIITWPGLSSKLITKNLPPSVNTEKGYPNQETQNTQSTKPPKMYDNQLKIIKVNIKRVKNY